LNSVFTNTNYDQPINYIKDVNNNYSNQSNMKAFFEDKFNLNSIASLNSPVSINSPTTSSLSTNQKEDDKEDLFFNSMNTALNFSKNTTNTNIETGASMSMAASSTVKSDNNGAEEDELLTFGDQFIQDNRKNMNQNRIKSSMLGAKKHLSKKKREQKQESLDQNIETDSNTAINLTINAPDIVIEPSPSSKSKRCYCPICNQSFTQRNSLNRHIRSHTGDRPFPCTECNKRFSDKQRLLIHGRIHTGEKPFACSLCGRSFTQKSTVKR